MCTRSHFGADEHPSYEPYDRRRDALALALVKTCVERGVPLFGVCRGFQEMNVAYGGSLHPEIRDLPGRMNHRMPRLPSGEIHPDLEVVYGDRHDVRLTPGGVFAKLLGSETIRVNSLHGQGILEPGKRIVVEGVAEDETIEAIRVADAPGFALGRAMARRGRSADESDQPHAVSGLWRRGRRAQPSPLTAALRADLTPAAARATTPRDGGNSMSFNTFGHLFRVTTFGESHGPAIGCVVDGCPPRIPLTAADIQADLDKRRPGQSRFTTQRREPDAVKILSGVFADEATGSRSPPARRSRC